LEMHSQEVYNMLYGDWNMEEALDVRYEEGEARGETKGLLRAAQKMKASDY